MAWKYLTFLIACYTIALATWFTYTHLGTLDTATFLFVWGLAFLWLLVSLVLQVADLIANRPNQYRRNK
jgi:hypothetical protein